MLLKLRRSQRQGGLTGGKVFFALDARVEVSPEERMLIDKYRLGDLSVYDSEARKQQSQAAAGSFYDAQGSGSWLSIAKGATRLAMAAFTLRVTINGLVNGQHIECKSLDELLGAEEAIREACDNLKNYLATALTFDGRELVLEF